MIGNKLTYITVFILFFNVNLFGQAEVDLMEKLLTYKQQSLKHQAVIAWNI